MNIRIVTKKRKYLIIQLACASSSNWSSMYSSRGCGCNNGIDVLINTIVTPTTPTITYNGPITRARARQLNYQVLSFLGNESNVHENMMLPKLDTFVLLTNEGPSLEKDEHWSKNKHGDDGMRKGTRTELQVMISGSRSHHNGCMKPWTKYTRCHFINFVPRLF